MRRAILSPLLLVLSAGFANTVPARPVDRDRLVPGRVTVPVTPASSYQFPTYYFGGTTWAADSMRWEAVPDSVWTFETGVGSHYQHTDSHKNPSLHAAMEGWTGLDLTAAPTGEQQFRRVSAADFGGNPACVGSPAGLGGDYSFWAGLFEDEAAALCYAAGQGYGNYWGICIQKLYSYGGEGCLQLEFSYVLDTEEGYDYAFVFVDSTGSSSVAGTEPVWKRSGVSSGTQVLDLEEGVSLRSDAGPIRVLFCVNSDALYSDEDGGLVTSCGAFAVDDIVASSAGCGGALADTSDFETDTDGWELETAPVFSVGDFSNLAAVQDLPTPRVTPCDLGDSVLVVFDPDGGPDHYHPLRQDNLVLSPWIDLRRAGRVEHPTSFIEVGGYFDMPLLNFLFFNMAVQWYPDTCSTTGEVRVSDIVFQNHGYFGNDVLTCSPGVVLRSDISDLLPPHAEQVRIGLHVFNNCRFFGGSCLGVTNTTPWFDHIRFGVSAFSTLQAAIDAAAPGDTVWIPPGTYRNEGNVNLDFGGKTLVLKSESGPAETILHGSSRDRLFLFHSGEDSSCVVEGFTIQNGRETSDQGALLDGGCVEITNGSSPTFRDCVFQYGAATQGGAVHADASSEPRFLDCTFRNCQAEIGGAVAVISIRLERCLFESNVAVQDGGGLHAYAATVSGSTFRENRALTGGGAYLGASSLAENCTFTGNEAGDGGGLRLLGGIARACTVTGNHATSNGGGVSLLRGTQGEINVPAKLEYSSVTGNTADGLGGGVFQVGWTSITGGTIAANVAVRGGGIAGVGWFDQVAAAARLPGQPIPDPNPPGQASISGVLLTGNSADQGGGLCVIDLPSGGFDVGVALTSSTVSGNAAETGGGIYLSPHLQSLPGDRLRVDSEQTILFGNCADLLGAEVAFTDTAGRVEFTCSNPDTFGIEGPGTWVMNGPQVLQNPEFCSPTPCTLAPTTAGIYMLAASSPNLPPHNACGVLIGALGNGCTIVETPPEETPAVVLPVLAVDRNPFRGRLAIRYEAPENVQPTLRIYDVRGALVADVALSGSQGIATWDGAGRDGSEAPAGVYFLQLVAGGEHRSLRVVRLQ